VREHGRRALASALECEATIARADGVSSKMLPSRISRVRITLALFHFSIVIISLHRTHDARHAPKVHFIARFRSAAPLRCIASRPRHRSNFFDGLIDHTLARSTRKTFHRDFTRRGMNARDLIGRNADRPSWTPKFTPLCRRSRIRGSFIICSFTFVKLFFFFFLPHTSAR